MEMRPGYKLTEVGVIPDDWETTTVREIASSVRNAIVGGPFGSDLVSNDYVEEGVPVIRGQNMGCRFVSNSFAFVTSSKASSLASNLARPGDLIVTQRGTLGQVSLVPEQPFEHYLVSQSQMKVSVNRKIADPTFFYYVLSSSGQQKFIRQNTIQTGVPHINLGILRTIPLQQPSLPEQEAIAEALSDANALIESLEQLLAKTRHLKQGAMQQLLTGKKRLPGFNSKSGHKQSEVRAIPEDWIVRRLGEGIKLSSGYHVLAQHCNTNGDGVPYITGPADFANGAIQHTKYTTRPGTICKANDILVTVKGSGAGTIVLADAEYCISRQLMALRICDWDTHYIYFSLLRDASLFGAAAAGLIPGLSRIDILNKNILLPTIKAEQEAIATVLSEMDAEIDALEAKLAKTRQIKQGMMQQLLTGRIRLVRASQTNSSTL
jgi:type I restriction enzyme S subunit